MPAVLASVIVFIVNLTDITITKNLVRLTSACIFEIAYTKDQLR